MMARKMYPVSTNQHKALEKSSLVSSDRACQALTELLNNSQQLVGGEAVSLVRGGAAV